jgi:hypothetical protein
MVQPAEPPVMELETMLSIELAGWWFGTMQFYDFPYIGNNYPN